MPAFAARTPARLREARSVLKHISTVGALRWNNQQLFLQRSNRAGNMRKVPVDLFLRNAQCLRQISGVMSPVHQKLYHLPPDGLRRRIVIPVIYRHYSCTWLSD
jgi:hypothetical protein